MDLVEALFRKQHERLHGDRDRRVTLRKPERMALTPRGDGQNTPALIPYIREEAPGWLEAWANVAVRLAAAGSRDRR